MNDLHMKICMSIKKMNYLYIDVYTILYFVMNDLNALNRMLTVKFELRIDWYTNKGQISSTMLNVIMCHSNP